MVAEHNLLHTKYPKGDPYMPAYKKIIFDIRGQGQVGSSFLGENAMFAEAYLNCNVIQIAITYSFQTVKCRFTQVSPTCGSFISWISFYFWYFVHLINIIVYV